MESTTPVSVRLIALFMVAAICALGLRLSDFIGGLDALSQPALAAAQTAEEDQGSEGDHGTEDAHDGDASGDRSDTEDGEAGDPGSDGGSDTPSSSLPTASAFGRLPSAEELELISQLRERRQQLDQREQELDLQAQLLAATEKTILDKTARLEELNEQIKKHLRLFDEREAAQLDAIVSVYEKMKPKEAAPIFQALDITTQLDIVTRMKPAKIASILAKMSPGKATELTAELARMAEPPTADDLETNAGR